MNFNSAEDIVSIGLSDRKIKMATQEALNKFICNQQTPELNVLEVNNLGDEHTVLHYNVLGLRGFTESATQEIIELADICKSADYQWKWWLSQTPAKRKSSQNNAKHGGGPVVGSAPMRHDSVKPTVLNNLPGLDITGTGCYWGVHSYVGEL